MDLSTTYMGLSLRTPLVPSASPLSQDVDNIRRMEDAGAAAVVLQSLFQEQFRGEPLLPCLHQRPDFDVAAEPLAVPDGARLLSPDAYFEHVRRAKEAVSIPIIASLNGWSAGDWLEAARSIEQAGADALELNVFVVPTDPAVTSEQLEHDYVETVLAVRRRVSIPLAVKMTAFLTTPARMAARLVEAGVNGLALFNRYNMPDLDLETGSTKLRGRHSCAHAMRLPLRWISILYGRVKTDLAATGGVYNGLDALKMLLVGARVAHLCSVLLTQGVEQIRVIERRMREWMKQHGYETVAQLEGKMSHLRCDDAAGFERAQYMNVLRSLTI